VKTLKERFPEIFPERIDADGKFEVPKTLIFAKSDSHADDIIQIVREEFAEENKFCKRITYTADDPKSTLAQFRNDYYPRIAVTVDMIATGTDVRPLECLFFMRDVNSRNYFEQMKGRGTRTITLDELKKVTPSAKYTKDHFVIVDAIGVTKSLKTDSRPLEKKPSVPLKDLLGAVAVGARDEDLFTSLANRLIRLERRINEQERAKVFEKTKGKSLAQIAKELLHAYNPDVIEELGEQIKNKMPDESPAAIESAIQKSHSAIIEEAAKVFTGELNTYIENVRKTHEQLIDTINRDTLTNIGWDGQNKAKANELIKEFTAWIEANKNEIIALQIFYNQPYRRRELTYAMIKEVSDKLKSDKPALAPLRLWDAYEQQETALAGITQRSSPKTELVALVSLLRKVTGVDKVLSPYDKTVDKNFQEWVFRKQAGALKFTEEQMQWLRMIKDYIAISFHIDKDDFALSPFGDNGGLGRMWELFGEKTEEIIIELNEALVA
jgi:type I restriction enzyme R subunit